MLVKHVRWAARKIAPALLSITALLAAPFAVVNTAIAQDDYEAGYDEEYDDEYDDDTAWWENNANYNEDEAYDPTDWFDGNNYEYDYDYYDGGYDDNDYDNDWTYDYYDYGYGDEYGYYGNDGNELGLFD